MDFEIIYSWCFNYVECFDSTPSAAIIILDKDLESFSSLKSQQEVAGHAEVAENSRKRKNSRLRAEMKHLREWVLLTKMAASKDGERLRAEADDKGG